MKKLLELSSIFYKFAQDSALTSPNVVVEPAQPILNKAIQLLKRYNPSFFVGVRKIIVAPSSYYGFVESGEDKDPAVVNINLQKIINESGGNPNSPEAIMSAALTIAHEGAHTHTYKQEGGFIGEETPAESEE